MPAVLVAAVTPGSDVDATGGAAGTLRLYQLSCGCVDGIYLSKRAGQVHLDTF